MTGKTRICFVCLGNIVRSPLAENMFHHLARQAGLEHTYILESAGTGAWHTGEPPDVRMRRVAAQHGLVYDGKARQFVRSDFERFDWIIAMDIGNRRDLLRLSPSPEHVGKIHLMRAFDPLGGADASVPDPYYGGLDGFEEVYAIIERSCTGLLQALQSGQLAGKT